MFNGNRRFDGRQSEQIYNQELYTIHEILKHFLDMPEDYNPEVGPDSNLEQAGALWLDQQSNPGNAHVMYRDSDKVWKPIFDDWFSITKNIRSEERPTNPVEGQLWISSTGILYWYNGSLWTPLKTQIADSTEFNTNAISNFLMLDPLKMTGGYIVENLASMAQAAGSATEWQPGTRYEVGALVFYTYLGETHFYIYTDKTCTWKNGSHISSLTFTEELASGYLEQITLYSQYLIPSEVMDKIFINGMYSGPSNYTRVSDVCIQVSLNVYGGKAVAAVHVNPAMLKNISKKIIKIEKDPSNVSDYKMIQVSPINTEYYGFKDGHGKLLIKGEDYILQANGIQLSDSVIGTFDFIYCITYEFDTHVITDGSVVRETTTLNNRSSIWVGELNDFDSVMVFAEGLALEENCWDYDKDDSSGLIRLYGFDKDGNVTSDASKTEFSLFSTETDFAVMRFRYKTGTNAITEDMVTLKKVNKKNTYVASIPIPSHYANPLLFVQGVNLNLLLSDYSIENGMAIVNDVPPGTSYYVVDATRSDNYEMHVSQGVVGATGKIPITDTELLSGSAQPIVFVDGFYISSNDLDLSDPNYIAINGLTQGQEYVLLKDKLDSNNSLLYDGSVSQLTIAVDHDFDEALVYIQNSLIIDCGATYTTSLNESLAANNEIQRIVAKDSSQWYCYKKDANQWSMIVDPDEILMLNQSCAGYTIDDKAINILGNYGASDCTYYTYTYASRVEKPLIKGYATITRTLGDEVFYQLNREHRYSVGDNTLSVWMNGTKQNAVEHQLTEVSSNGKQTTVQGFLLPKPTDAYGYELATIPTCYYIIEPKESGEHKACIAETMKSLIGTNTYQTNSLILAPGTIKVYIDGYRQPQGSYIVNGSDTITLVDPVVSDNLDYATIKNDDGTLSFVKANSRSNVYVEVRQDFRLKEKTVFLTNKNLQSCIQGATAVFDITTMFASEQVLPKDLFAAQSSEINIFVDGANIGMDFENKQSQGLIIIYNTEVVKSLAEGTAITFEWR